MLRDMGLHPNYGLGSAPQEIQRGYTLTAQTIQPRYP